MDPKWLALAAVVAGLGLVIAGFATLGQGEAGLDRLPTNLAMIGGGALLVLIGGGYVLVRAFLKL